MAQASANELIGKFIYSCSHDLRGPVATIRGLVKLAENYPDQVESNNCMRMIGECSDKLDNLICSLEEYMVNEKHKIHTEIVDSEALMSETISLHESEMVAKSIRFQYKADVKLWVTDRYCVSQILKHLIVNAIAFSDPEKSQKEIDVRIRDAPLASCLEVSDNGLGIPKESQLKVFDIFYRAHPVSTGSGLGLFLVRQLVMKMGGRVQIESKVNIGTTIKVILPWVKLPTAQRSTERLFPV